MRKALVVGIDYYAKVAALSGCVNDAYNVKGALERHGHGSPNFDISLMVATNAHSAVDRPKLKEKIRDLFHDDSEIALLYFSGHGFVEPVGGYLVTSECSTGDDGVSMDEVLSLANSSPAKSKVIILDCCHSGALGSPVVTDGKSVLSEGITILTASTKDQYAVESGGTGLFTSLLVDALSGAAANLVGAITPGSVYAHIDQSLGSWEQRPIFKTNVKRFVSLKEVQPAISLEDLRRITALFADDSSVISLNPSYEETSDSPDSMRVDEFKTLQRLSRVNLVRPIDEEHMYYAAMNSKSCRLTALGAHYWGLVKKGRI